MPCILLYASRGLADVHFTRKRHRKRHTSKFKAGTYPACTWGIYGTGVVKGLGATLCFKIHMTLAISLSQTSAGGLLHARWNTQLVYGNLCVCVEVSRAPYRTPSACAKGATYSDTPPAVLHPESLTAQAGYPYRHSAIAQVVSGPNCFQALGSSPGLLQSPIL